MESKNTKSFRGVVATALPAFSLALALLPACAGTAAESAGAADASQVTRRDIHITHQDCAVNGSNAEKMDVGGDARPDIIVVRSGGREVCRSVDMNFDGIVDSWIYTDASGNAVRRENDYDRDGGIDEIAIYQNGVLIEKQRATTLVGRLDTWHFYQNGKLARTERDSDGDSQIDQWWEYPKPDRPECPLIHTDVDGDGHPDPGATVNVCGEDSGYVPPERPSEKAPSGATFDKANPSDVPTELDQKPVPDAEGSKK